MADTSIEWTDVTWNPVSGCTVLSPGCTNCYAMRMAARLEAMGAPKYQGLTRRTGGRAKWNGTVRTDEAALVAPLHWNRPRMVFVNSMSDLFHAAVPEEFIARVWDVMARASEHTFQILTKRPERMAEAAKHLQVLPNVWLGTSIESAEYLSRLDDLRRARAYVRFVSFEPLLSSVGQPNLNGVNWAIVGGEYGPQARPMDRDWVDDIHAACRTHDVAFFFKQWGGRNKKATGRVLDGKIWDEFPIASDQAERPLFSVQGLSQPGMDSIQRKTG
jgi:protein gp37